MSNQHKKSLEVSLQQLDRLLRGPALPPLPGRVDPRRVYSGLFAAKNLCHGLAERAGWWVDLETGCKIDADDPLVFGQKIALIHSEVDEAVEPYLEMALLVVAGGAAVHKHISRALEGHRKNLMDEHLPHRRAVEVEFADALIRILDTAGAMKLDVAGAVIEKLAYNQQRADHKLENRREANGKRY